TLFEVYRPFREHYDDDDDGILIGIEVEYVGFASIAAVESANCAVYRLTTVPRRSGLVTAY
ncbi:MAG TPA: hypothetical protein DD672_13665, partial [Gammaproteobacteria bacterium]|nr:hypothetical protein [Gammaproteobacteria bacterium]